MPEIPNNCKDFGGFILEQLEMACLKIKINGYIFICELTDEGQPKHAGCLKWYNIFFVYGWTQLNMLRDENHLMFIKELKPLYKQFQCAEFESCFMIHTY